MKQKVRLVGSVGVEVRRNGKIVYKEEGKNTWVLDGVQQVVAWMVGNAADRPTHIGIGTNNTPATSTQTGLIAELDYATYTDTGTREAATSSPTKTNFTSDTAQYQATFTFVASGITIYETGVFNAVTGGEMFARRTIGGFTPAINDQMTITWKLGFTI